MTISFRAGEDEELYKEFCDNAGIDYSTLPRNIIHDTAHNERVQTFVKDWLSSDNNSFVSYLIEETDKTQYEEAFNRIQAGLEYGLDDQVREGFEALEEQEHPDADRIKLLLINIDDKYGELLQN